MTDTKDKMTFREAVSAFVYECDGVEGAVGMTFIILGVLMGIILGFMFAWKFMLAALFMVAAVAGLFAFFAWASGEL